MKPNKKKIIDRMDDVQLAGIWLGDWSIYCFV